MPLTMAKTGDTVTIRKITGRDEVRQHLAELGFVVDSDVTVVSEIAGNLILQVKDSRIALDKTMANRIMICGCALIPSRTGVSGRYGIVNGCVRET